MIGSDDICNDAYFELIDKLKNVNYLVGFDDMYFYQTLTKQLYYFKGYENKKASLGAFRYYSKKVLDKCEWNLWGSEKRNKH